MRFASAPLVAALLLTVAPAAPAANDRAVTPGGDASTGKHCLGEPRPRWLLGSTLILQTNPLGAEEQLQLGRCVPLILTPGDLFDYTNFQVGLTAYLGPVYAMPGVFASIAPLSVVELRAEAEWIGQWPIPLDGAGYFPLSGYDAPWATLPAADARSAQGYTVSFTLNLQAEVPVAPRWSLLVVDSASGALWQLGDASYYYNVRHDLPMARRDGRLENMALLLVNHDLSARVKVRLGVTDDLARVTGSGYQQNVLGAMLTGVISRWPSAQSETQPFLRIGGYTQHANRKGELQIFGGVGMTFDVGPARRR